MLAVPERADSFDPAQIDMPARAVGGNWHIAEGNAAGKNAAGVIREDIAAQEKAKIATLEKYLPTQMSQAEIEVLVVSAIAQAGATTSKDMGAVMAIIRPLTQGKADGKVVSEVVKSKLSGG